MRAEVLELPRTNAQGCAWSSPEIGEVIAVLDQFNRDTTSTKLEHGVGVYMPLTGFGNELNLGSHLIVRDR